MVPSAVDSLATSEVETVGTVGGADEPDVSASLGAFGVSLATPGSGVVIAADISDSRFRPVVDCSDAIPASPEGAVSVDELTGRPVLPTPSPGTRGAADVVSDVTIEDMAGIEDAG